MKILVFAGCNDKKLISKLSPILDSKYVEKLYLIRQIPMDFEHPKLVQLPTLPFLRKLLPLRELSRVISGIKVLLSDDIDMVMGIHFRMHGIYAYYLSKVFKKKYSFLSIESPEKYKGWKLFTNAMKIASLIGVRGSNSMKYLENLGVDSSNLLITQNEFQIEEIENKNKEKKYDLIYIGNFVEEKDLPLWVNVLEKVKQKESEVRAVMLGDGYQQDLIVEMIKDKGLEENIDLVGRKSNVFDYIDESSLLLMTSKTEGLPMVVVESMSRAVPCVVPNVGDIIDLVDDGKNGMVIDSREPQDYADAIIELLEDKEKYKKMCAISLESVKKMSLMTTHEELVKVWDKALYNLK